MKNTLGIIMAGSIVLASCGGSKLNNEQAGSELATISIKKLPTQATTVGLAYSLVKFEYKRSSESIFTSMEFNPNESFEKKLPTGSYAFKLHLLDASKNIVASSEFTPCSSKSMTLISGKNTVSFDLCTKYAFKVQSSNEDASVEIESKWNRIQSLVFYKGIECKNDRASFKIDVTVNDKQEVIRTLELFDVLDSLTKKAIEYCVSDSISNNDVYYCYYKNGNYYNKAYINYDKLGENLIGASMYYNDKTSTFATSECTLSE